jgi:hypothetical protein
MSVQKLLPIIYEEDTAKVLTELKQGRVNYIDLSSWTFADRFFAFLLSTDFFKQCVQHYPSPRKKEEVPVWFLLTCALQMKLHTTSVYSQLPGILGSGAIMARVGFNVGRVEGGGFNHKNRTDRHSAVDHDSVRKFYKHSDPVLMRQWYNRTVVQYMRQHRAFDKHGIFVLDQTHVVVPDNTHYKDATRMAVDEHGQRIDTSNMGEAEKKTIRYRLTYSLSELLHIGKEEPGYFIAGYQWGAGTEDELVHGEQLVKGFTQAVGKGVMKLLIVDRGYIAGDFITLVKKELGAEVLIPLRTNMDIFTHALRVARQDEYRSAWSVYNTYVHEKIQYIEKVIFMEEVGQWEACAVPLHVCLMSVEGIDGSVKTWGIATTWKPRNAAEVFDLYGLRVSIEERHKQFKKFWNIGKFSSPHASLIEAHVLFTLLTYSLIQLYLMKKHLTDLADKTIQTLRNLEHTGKDCVVVYAQKKFGIFGLAHYSTTIMDLEGDPKERFKGWLQRFEKNDKRWTE